MAAALVGGAFLSSFLNVLFERLASPDVLNWLRGKKGDQKMLRRLKTSLHIVRAVLDDAEQKQITDTNVKEWLVDLQDAVYVADDLLDEVATQAATQKKDPGNSQSQSLILDDQRDMVAEIEDIIERLSSIVDFKDALRLKENADDTMSRRLPSTSLVEKSKIYGRDEDMEAIVKLLLDDHFEGEIPVISIVGIGGIGKTTLAQLVYNDDRVKGKFESRAWVCVAEKFDVVNVTKTIIEALTSSPCYMSNFDLLQTRLVEMLNGKTFLIVLDDVWSYDANLWKSFIKPFKHGKKGSKILVTTRIEKVAKVASVNPIIPPYNLSLLSEGDCWSLFLKCSFLSTESRGYVTLEKIGRKIVKKCNGLPLAVETLGGLLCTKCEAKEWNEILESEIWEFPEDESMIIPALRISYHYLPSHLKRCFVYCSLFPQDYKFNKDELILLWMAEDFLQPMGKKTLEEIGCEYFNGVVARSFFQSSKRDNGLYVMHDLMHDLAKLCVGKFYFRADDIGNEIEIGSITRHLSCNVRGMDQVSELLTACHGTKHIRTFACKRDWWNFRHTETDPFNIEFSHMKCLRVLIFNYLPLKTLHHSIRELILMRYLDLSFTNIVELPESLCRLYNLQTLKLRWCEELETFPSGMKNLVNLRHLDIRGTDRLKEMPKGMSKMKHLQFLSDYIVGEHEENKIKELGPLLNLHGRLPISHLENVISANEALEARMSEKMHVNILELKWSYNINVADDSETERDILDKLQPHRDLKELSVDGYRGTKFPDWLGYSSYKHMTSLKLNDCKNCCTLPSLGQLPYLNYLHISKFDRLRSIGAEFYRGDESRQETTPFPSLETLSFYDLQCWKKWCSIEFAFPQLKKLTIEKCPELTGDLPGHLPKLYELFIDETCQKLKCFLPRAPAMLKINLQFDNKLKIQELPPSIRTLTITGSQLVESAFEAMRHTQPTCLQTLSISHCDSFISFPGDLLPASLQFLGVYECKKLDFPTPQQHESLQALTISSSCDSLLSFPLSAFPNIRKLNISSCENMESLVVSQSHSHNASNSRLSCLTIWNCPKLKVLPVHGYSGTKFPDWHSSYKHMTHLELYRCENCCTLPSFGQLPSLNYLSISEFDGLISIGNEFYRGADSCSETPFPSLETLRFKELKCWKKWQSIEFAFPKLKELTISRCPMLVGDLPSHLPKLKQLDIDKTCQKLACFLPRAPAVRELNLEFDNELRMQELPPSIRTLRIKGSQLVEFVFEAMRHTQLTCLQTLSISNCDSLISFPWDLLPASLQSLDVYDCKKLDFPTQQQQQHDLLQRLMIRSSCDSLATFPLSVFPNLSQLIISGYENLESLVVSHSHDASNSRLCHLTISECLKFVSLPTLGIAAPQLESLTIRDCPEIDSFGEGGLPPNLRKLVIERCLKLGDNVASMDLSTQSLTRLVIEGASESVKSFPKEGCLPASLQYLKLVGFPSLEKLDCSGLSHLTSLQSLFIWRCEKLENMTGERLPTSLKDLHIDDCPMLDQRFKVKDPQVWPKISHTKDILVDWKQIS